ncbi:MAG: helix-turn-helix domain-containing protein [Kiloniellales bacterium]
MSKSGQMAIQGLKEGLAFLSGEDVPGLVVHIPEEVDAAKIRKRAGLSQEKFARRIGVSVATLRQWEQGRRVPTGPARVLLAMLAKNPRVVEETLNAA